MALSPGTRLGRYQVAAEIGAGGTGEVYRGTDPDLKRDVAIKEAYNGRVLFYRNGDAMMAVDVTPGPTLKAGTPRRLFEKHYETSLALYANYSTTGEGQRFLMIKQIDQQEESPPQINVAMNWFDELRRAMAAK